MVKLVWAVMGTRIARGLALAVVGLGLCLAGCSSSAKRDGSGSGADGGTPAGAGEARGHILVAVTVDWEGAYLSDDGLDTLDAMRGKLPGVPLTHFVSAAYFTRAPAAGDAASELKGAAKSGDEVAVHVHAWQSLAKAAGVKPRLTPSFLSGGDKLLEFEGGDVGFDSDLDNYSVKDLRAMIATSRKLLVEAGLTPSTSFRAGGYLGTAKVLEAARAEGHLVDSSAVDHRQIDDAEGSKLPQRLKEVWPTIETGSQPYAIKTGAGDILEIPIAGFAEDVTAAEVEGLLHDAHARLTKTPGTDVFVVLGFHQETAHEFGPKLVEALEKARKDTVLAPLLRFVTVEAAAKSAPKGSPM